MNTNKLALKSVRRAMQLIEDASIYLWNAKYCIDDNYDYEYTNLDCSIQAGLASLNNTYNDLKRDINSMED